MRRITIDIEDIPTPEADLRHMKPDDEREVLTIALPVAKGEYAVEELEKEFIRRVQIALNPAYGALPEGLLKTTALESDI